MRVDTRSRVGLACAAVLMSVAAGWVPASAGADTVEPSPAGSFRAMTYNIAGLPELLSSATTPRSASTTVIGAGLAPYDLVNVQEDFNYHAELYAADGHPYRTQTSGGAGIGSGLNTLSAYPLTGLERVTWERCWIGTGDCLTPKGFTYARVQLAENVSVDVYNLHTDAGSEANDMTARAANLSQLSRFIEDRSAGRAVVVMGDTNSRYTRSGDVIAEFAADTGLHDPWVDLVRAGQVPVTGENLPGCGDVEPVPGCEVVDKVFYRSSDHVTLTATAYRNAHAEFVTEAGEWLSDHYPITVDFAWQCADVCEPESEVETPSEGSSGSSAQTPLWSSSLGTTS